MSYVFTPPPVVSVPVVGRTERFPVHRIYCVGRNYEEHAKEMGFTGREPPFFFLKPADAIVVAEPGQTASTPYPSLTSNLHHEIELVVAIGKGGTDVAPDPALVLLDEPFSALDAGLRAAVREDVRTALRATGATGLLVTHDQEEALSTADLVAVVRDGVVVQSASPQQLYAAPGDLDVATFVGEAVVLPARVRDGVAETPLGRLALLRGDVAEGPGRVVIRPEQVRMVHSGGGTTARVVGTVFYGHDASVRLQVPGPDGSPLPVLCRTQGPLPTTEEIGVVVAGPVSFFADT